MSIEVFMGGLPESVTGEDVESWLSDEAFEYKHVRFFKGCCVISVKDEEQAEAIMQRYHQAPLEDRILVCELARSKPDRQKRLERREKRNGR